MVMNREVWMVMAHEVTMASLFLKCIDLDSIHETNTIQQNLKRACDEIERQEDRR